MPELHEMTDDALVAQLRVWADDLAEQIPPVAAPTAERGVRLRPPRPLLVAAALVVVLGLAAAIVAAGGGDDGDGEVHVGTTAPPTTTVVPDRPLFETIWWVVGITEDGEEHEVPHDLLAELALVPTGTCSEGYVECAGTAQVSGFDGCNTFGGTVTVDGDRIVGSGTGGTMVGCTDPVGSLSGLLRSLFAGESRATVDGDTLTLRKAEDDLVVTLAAGEGVGPPLAEGETVLVDDRGQAAHRLSWRAVETAHGPGVELLLVIGGRGATVELASGGAEGWMQAGVVGYEPGVVFGLVDARATTVAFEPDGERVDVPTIALDGVAEMRAFVAVVPDTPIRWSLRATDADGAFVSAYDHRG